MTKIAKNILSPNYEDVMDIFMKSEQYHGFEQPEHFMFDKLQKHVREKIGDTPYTGGVLEASPYILRIYLLVAGQRCKTFAEQRMVETKTENQYSIWLCS